MRESAIEKAYCKRLQKQGALTYKFVSPGRVGVPDRIILFPINNDHVNIVSKYIYFIEFKALNKSARPVQLREHNRLINMGFKVELIDAL